MSFKSSDRGRVNDDAPFLTNRPYLLQSGSEPGRNKKCADQIDFNCLSEAIDRVWSKLSTNGLYCRSDSSAIDQNPGCPMRRFGGVETRGYAAFIGYIDWLK